MGSAVQGSPFTPEQLEYWTTHESDTRVPNIIACATITGFFSTLFLGLRILGRWWQRNGFRLDLSDWLLIVAWVFFVTTAVAFGLMTPYGGGRHVIYITDPYMLQVFAIVSEGFYGFSMGFLKLSILSLYASIFPSKTFRLYLWIVAVFIAGWTLTASLGAFLQCVPIQKAYQSNLDGYCIHFGQLSLVVGVCNVVTDFIIIALPLPLVLKLHTSAEKKLVISGTFAAGSSAVIVSIVRLVYSLDVGSVDGSWDAIPAGYMSCIELCVGFLVVSIPVYRSLYRKLARGETGGPTGWSYNVKSDAVPLRPTDAASYPGISVKTLNDGSHINGSGSDVAIGSKNTLHTTVASSDMTAMRRETGQGINVRADVQMERMAYRNGAWVQVPDEPGSETTRPY